MNVEPQPFSFKGMKEANDQEAFFGEKVEQLKGILGSVVSAAYYGKVLRKIMTAELTELQEEIIFQVFQEKGLTKDENEIKLSRKIYGQNPLNFKELKTADDKNAVFEQIMEQLVRVLGLRKNNNKDVPELYYRKVIHRIFKEEFTEEQEGKIWTAFKDLELELEGAEIIISRNIYRYDPQKDNKFKMTLEFIQKQNLWGKISPNIQTLSPMYHEQIVNKYKELILQTRFDEMLVALDSVNWNDSGGSESRIQIIKNFQKTHFLERGYKNLGWGSVYNLIRAKLSLLSVAQLRGFLGVYIPTEDRSLMTHFGQLRYDILKAISNGGKDIPVEAIKAFFEGEKLCQEMPHQEMPQEITELCAWFNLEQEELDLIFGYLSDAWKGPFLLSRLKVYFQSFEKQGPWSFEAFKAFFGWVCKKWYNSEIENVPFLICVECLTQNLTEEQKKQIDVCALEALGQYYVFCYHCGITQAHCKELKNLENQGKETKNQFDLVLQDLKSLAAQYADPNYRTEHHWGYWANMLMYIDALDLSSELYLPILEVFEIKKGGRDIKGKVTISVAKRAKSYFNYYIYGIEAEKPTIVSTKWEGEKCTFLLDNKKWVEVNQGWIKENLQEEKNKSKDLVVIVQKVVDVLIEFKWPELGPLSKEKIDEYNKEMSQALKGFIIPLRDAIGHPKFVSSYNRLLDFGPSHASGASLIIKEMSDFWNTGMNGAPFFVNLMRKLLPIGLEELFRTKEEVRYLAALKSLKFKKPCDLPFDIQHEAIEGLPTEYKNYFQTKGIDEPDLNGLPFRLLSLKYQSKAGEEKDVEFIQSSSPTDSKGINPEFRVFLGNEPKNITTKSLIVLLQNKSDSSEAEWMKELMKKRNDVYVVNCPVFGDFHMQEGKFAVPELFPTYTSFKNALMEKFIAFSKGFFTKGQVEVNTPGNYLMPVSWYDDVKDDLAICMDQVKDIFFPNTSELKASDRRIFIRLFLIRYAFYLIRYTGATTFTFLCNHSAHSTEVYNPLMVKVLTTLFNNKDAIAYGEGDNAFTIEEMGRSLVKGTLIKKGADASHDELTEVFTFLDRFSEKINKLPEEEVKEKLRAIRESFSIQSMAPSDFTIRPIEKK